MKSKLVTLLMSLIALSSCGDGNNPSEPGGTPDKYKVNFANFDLGNKTELFLNGGDTYTQVKDFMNAELGDTYVTTIMTTISNSVKIEKSEFLDGYTNVQGLIAGTSSKNGEFHCEFNRTIKTIKIKAQQYYNIYHFKDSSSEYDAIHYDGQEYIENPDGEDYYIGYYQYQINGQVITGPGKTYVYDDNWLPVIDIPETTTETIELNSNYFTITGFGGVRTRIYEMSFEFLD